MAAKTEERRKVKRGDIASYLGVGWRVVNRLIRDGQIELEPDPLDGRRKLADCAKLDRLKEASLGNGFGVKG